MVQDFYDKVAKKFGNYDNPARYIQEFSAGAPEEIFKQKLIEVSGKNKIVLDSGCGDGRFTLQMAKYFKKIVGNDTSELMLKAAKKLQEEKRIKNVELILESTRKLNFPNKHFDVIYSRRSPTDYPLFYRMLKDEGYFLFIDIGEKDTKDLKLIFGRGQNFGNWENSELIREKAEMESAGFNVIYAEEFEYSDYFLTYQDLDTFLQGVPIFEDFDSEKDKKYLKEYVSKFQTEKGINLPRHRVVFVAQK